MQITKKSILTGVEHTREINVTPEQIAHWKRSGDHIQDAFPHLSPDDREFMISGITSEEWKDSFGDD